MKLIFNLVLTILIFSIWAGFALLIINPWYRDDLPGYTIGRICIWEYGAVLIAGILSFYMTKKWGYPEIQKTNGETRFTLNSKYGYFFVGYLCIAVAVAIWQFWIFSQKF